MRALISWSGGKDAHAALNLLRRNGRDAIAGLLTTFVRGPDRVAIHETPAELVRRQALALRLPLVEAFMPAGASNAQYEAALAEALATPPARGVDTLVFGDLFLEDIRAYRDALAARMGLRPLYPVWGRDTAAFAQAVLASQVRAVVCSVDLARMPLVLAGRAYDAAFLRDLPEGIDPCGENGEFHTFVLDGPGFHHPVAFHQGAPTVRDGLGCCPLW